MVHDYLEYLEDPDHQFLLFDHWLLDYQEYLEILEDL
tara:strand:- start:567 stop:677 length:111 start_codon:yes stop_codon:yes gene_type:complete